MVTPYLGIQNPLHQGTALRAVIPDFGNQSPPPGTVTPPTWISPIHVSQSLLSQDL